MAEGIVRLVIDDEQKLTAAEVAAGIVTKLRIGGLTLPLTGPQVVQMFHGDDVRMKVPKALPSPRPPPLNGSPPQRAGWGQYNELKAAILNILRRQSLTTGDLGKRIKHDYPRLIKPGTKPIGQLCYQMKMERVIENDGPVTPWRLVGAAGKRQPGRRR